jgi:hypothetical protein
MIKCLWKANTHAQEGKHLVVLAHFAKVLKKKKEQV